MVTLKAEGQNFLARFPVLKGAFIALIIQLVLVLILTTLFHFSNLSDKYMNMMSLAIVIVSLLGGGMEAAKTAEARFLLNGLGVGVTCLVLVFLVSFLGGNGIEPAALGVRTLCYLGAGTLGGMLGAILSK